MAFTADITQFGHNFVGALVVVNEANLEYRLNDHEGGTENTQFRINFKVYVSQAAKDAGGQEMINEWLDGAVDADTDITDGNLKDVAEAQVKADARFSNVA